MRTFLIQVCMAFLFAWGLRANHHPAIFNVMVFGAKADGKTDCSKAFLSAWDKACKWRGRARVWIPKGVYLVGATSFEGPCNGPVEFHINGLLNSPTDLARFPDPTWIRFYQTSGLAIGGGGVLDGQGASAWRRNDCAINPHCKFPPISLRFDFVNDTTVSRLHLKDSKNFHMNVFGCNRLNFDSITITAPEDSPNTDGIHIGDSSFINIENSVIATGDDCISFGPGSNNVYVGNVTCGPGHGISIGSLGTFQDENPVNGLHVKNCTLKGTSNGVRIKTWAKSYPNVIKNLTFEYIQMQDVYNPIVIDQEYCPNHNCDHKTASNVQIQDIHYRNIWGISTSKVALNFVCSSTVPCQYLELRDIDLTYRGKDGPVAANCSNARGYAKGEVYPASCLE